MRAIIPIAGVALALAACGNNGQAGNTTNLDEGLTAESIVSNDVTAIDAVTGDAANMAADMDVGFTNEMGNDLENAVNSEPASRRSAGAKPAVPAPATNETAGNEAANAAE